MARHIIHEAKLFDIPGQSVIATDRAGMIVYWSAEAELMFGWRRDEAIGRNVIEVTPSEQSKDQAVQIMERLNAGQSWTGDFQVRHRSGATFFVRVTDVPVRSPKGELIGIVGVSTMPGTAAAKMRVRRQRAKRERPAPGP